VDSPILFVPRSIGELERTAARQSSKRTRERHGVTSFISPYLLYRAYGSTFDYTPRFTLVAFLYGREKNLVIPVSVDEFVLETERLSQRMVAEMGPPMPGAKAPFHDQKWIAISYAGRTWFVSDRSHSHEFVSGLTALSDRWWLCISGITADKSAKNNAEYRRVVEKVLSTLEVSATEAP
jgi:hypothetical protein